MNLKFFKAYYWSCIQLIKYLYSLNFILMFFLPLVIIIMLILCLYLIITNNTENIIKKYERNEKFRGEFNVSK
jgi:uncharacterized membrane protein